MLVRYIPITLAVLTLAGAATALAGPTGAPLGPMSDVGTVPNGDLAAGLDGWGTVGPASSLVLADGPILSASDNVTVVGPVIALPSDAQVVPVSIGAPGANTVVAVRARPMDGGAEVVLTTVVPARGVSSFDIPVGQFAGRSIRLVLDPTMSIGRRMVIGGMGPVRSLLPGWSISGGQVSVVQAWGRTALQVQGAPTVAVTPVMPLAPPAQYLGFAVRGAGRVTARAGGATVAVVPKATAWTWAYAPVPAGGSAAALTLSATPVVGAALVVGPVATAARGVSVRAVAVKGGAIVATAGPGAQGMRAVITKGTRTVATGVVGTTGRVTLRASATGRATLVLLGDAGRTGATRPVRLP